jgi:hypothetical protein
MTPIHKVLATLAVTVSKKDLIRLRDHITNWNRLNEILLLGEQVSTDDLRRLIVLELAGKARKRILLALVSRLYSRQQKTLWKEILRCVKAK